MDGSDSSQQRRRQMEERLWAVLKPFFSGARAEAAARAGSCGLWKVELIGALHNLAGSESRTQSWQGLLPVFNTFRRSRLLFSWLFLFRKEHVNSVLFFLDSVDS